MESCRLLYSLLLLPCSRRHREDDSEDGAAEGGNKYLLAIACSVLPVPGKLNHPTSSLIGAAACS
ncbi:MAG TPA: hypothetical protein PK005_08995, partial [Bacteroidales bacterium]|nr:hypothetical protein [Bacteroidales bacterium]